MHLLDQSQLKSEVKALSLTQSLIDPLGDVERDGKGTWKDIQYGVTSAPFGLKDVHSVKWGSFKRAMGV